jgi:hypothetical protein
MSEFSESYHLRSERSEDAVELLRRAKRKGYVFQPVNGWVTFVAEKGTFEPDQLIVTAASNPLLHYVAAEDHGWSFALYDSNAAVISAYRCDWNDDIQFDDSRYSRSALEQFVPSAQPSLLDDFELLLHPKDFDELFDAEPSKQFAQAIGLEHYDWLDYEHIARDFRKSPEGHSGVTEVT